MAKNGEVGGKSHQQQECYVACFLHCQNLVNRRRRPWASKVIPKYKKKFIKFGGKIIKLRLR
jgi:hypothetical protein